MGKVLNWMKGISEEAADGAIARLAAIREIEETRGFRLINATYALERKWANEQLEIDRPEEQTVALRSYIKALDVLTNFLRTTNSNAEIARNTPLAARPQQMDINAYHELTFTKQ